MSDVSITKHLLGQVEQVCGPLLENGWNPQKETKESGVLRHPNLEPVEFGSQS